METTANIGKRWLLRLVGTLLIITLIFGLLPATFGQAEGAPKVKVPAKVKATANHSKRTLTVKWKKPARNTSVQVYLKAGKGKYKRVKTTKKSSFTIKNLKKNVKYNVRVRTKKGKRYSKFVAIKKTFIFKTSTGKKVAKTTTKTTTKPTTPTTPTDSKDPIAKSPVDEKNTRIVDLGFIKYLSIAFKEGYNKDNTVIELDGTVINDAVTNVTDNGSVAKWELTSLSPALLSVTDSNDTSTSQNITLSTNKTPEKPETVKDTAPAYILTHGPVSTFDYYLPNYDDEGNLRVHPSKTTFDLSEKSTGSAIKCYSPVAELKNTGNGQYGVSGTVELMFNWSTQEEKEWFEGIATSGAVQLVRHDESKEIITSGLRYTKETDVPHGSNRIAEIRIPVGQDNFFSNGRYYIRVNSTKKFNGKRAVLAPVHVVNEVKPSLELNHGTEIRSGQNIHFNVKDMAYAIKTPIEKVELTDPKGNSRELTFIDDWFLMGDLFIIYNDVTRNDGQGVNNIPLNGKYTVKICAEGFKDFSKSFKVAGGETADPVTTSFRSGQTSGLGKDLKIDAVSSASMSTGGDSGSGSGGSLSISADLLFNVDLLSNALILDRLGIANASATAICDRFEKEVIYDAVMDESGKECYTFSSYINAVNDAELDDNTYLTFKDFVRSGKGVKSTRNQSTHIKEILEDNLLGDIQEDGGYLGKKAPSLILKDGSYRILEGNDAVFVTASPEYMDKITSIVPADSTSSESISYDVAGEELIIHTEGMSFGEKTLTIKAEGYQKNRVAFVYAEDVEDVTLELITESPVAGSDVTVKAGVKGDLLRNFRGATLQYEGGAPKTLRNKGEIGTTGNDWYEISEDRLLFTMKGGLFKKPGSYTLLIDAEYYSGVRIDFEVGEKSVDESTLAEAPRVSGAASVEPFLFDSGYYRFSFTADGVDAGEQDTAIENYLNSIESINVSGTEYNKSLVSFTGPRAWQIAGDPNYGGKKIYLKMTTDGFSTADDSIVEIRAEGYRTQTFIVTKDLQLGFVI